MIITGKNRANESRFKAGSVSGMVKQSANREQAPYSPYMQAEITGVVV